MIEALKILLGCKKKNKTKEKVEKENKLIEDWCHLGGKEFIVTKSDTYNRMMIQFTPIYSQLEKHIGLSTLYFPYVPDRDDILTGIGKGQKIKMVFIDGFWKLKEPYEIEDIHNRNNPISDETLKKHINQRLLIKGLDNGLIEEILEWTRKGYNEGIQLDRAIENAIDEWYK